MKLLVMGGSFDPIHVGHLDFIRQTEREISADQIMLIPAKYPPHKPGVVLAPAEERFHMCTIAAKEVLKGAVVSRLELDRPGEASYTVDTIDALLEQQPDAAIYLAVGSDSFLAIETWKNYKRILEKVTLCTAARTPGEYESLFAFKKALEEKYDATVLIIELRENPVSSTQIRRRVAAGQRIDELVPAGVARYIKEKGLYRTPAAETPRFADPIPEIETYRKYVRGHLSEKRYIHSENVAKTAYALAKKYSADEKKAYIAGLVHDVTKDLGEEEQLQILSRFDIILTAEEKRMPKTYHAQTGALCAYTKLGIKDVEIISAIRYHTTGKAQMSLLDKIIYLADYISEDRTFPEAQQLREIAQNSLDAAVLQGLRFTIQDLLENQKPIHRDTIAAYNSLI